MTGISRQRAAEAVAELFGTSAEYAGTYYGTWQVRDREGKAWKFMYDSSIFAQVRQAGRRVSAHNQFCTEMVSPKLAYMEMEKL